MDLATLIPLFLKASIVLIVFGLGLSATMDDALYLFRRPGLLVRSLLAMNVIMPLFAILLAVTFDLPPAIKIALVALSVSPVPPVLPRKQVKGGGRAAYAVGLLVTAALLAILFVPAAVELLARTFQKEAHITPARVALVVLVTVLAPLVCGIGVRHFAHALAERIAQSVLLVGMLLLVICVVPVVLGKWSEIFAHFGNGWMALFALVGLAVGHLLGGPEPGDRVVLALATATRHPGVALAIVAGSSLGATDIPAAVLLYVVVSFLVAVPYLLWQKRRHPSVASLVASAHGG